MNTEFQITKDLQKGDKIIVKSIYGSELTYRLMDIYEVDNNDFSCTETATNGKSDGITYRFSRDNGSNYTAYQSSGSYSSATEVINKYNSYKEHYERFLNRIIERASTITITEEIVAEADKKQRERAASATDIH